MAVSDGSPPRLKADSVIARGDGFLTAEIDNEIVALNVEKGICYGLNKTASRIWNMMEKPTRIDEICAALVRQYEVEPGICERDVIELLQELRADGLIATPAKP